MNTTFEVVIDSMIAEQGESWREVFDFDNRSDLHNAVVITDGPSRCYRLTYVGAQWHVMEDHLTADELADFFAAFGSHWAMILNSWVDTSRGLTPVRAFIKNGRKRGRFSISIDVARQVAPLDKPTPGLVAPKAGHALHG